MKNNDFVVVGGGIVGLTTSILLAKSGKPVSLIESSPNCGGLLRSTTDQNGCHYDFGTHIPILTGVDVLDSLIFGAVDKRHEDWHEIHKLSPICRHSNTWNKGGSLLDARVLSKPDYENGLSEILSLKDMISKDCNLETFLFKTLGPVFTNKLINPVLEKLFFCKADQLIPDSAIFYFGLNRVTILDRERTNELMKDPVFASKLAFHSLDDYYAWDKNRQLDSYLYPKGGKGCGFWVESLVSIAKQAGVNIYTCTKVASMELKDASIVKIDFSNGETMRNPSSVFWSAPPALARRCLGHKISKPSTKFLTTNLYNLSFDKELLLTDNEYIWNWEPDHNTFRVTLYPNIDSDCKKPRVTAEVLSPPNVNNFPSISDVHKELIEIGICAENSTIDCSRQITLKNTFPVPNNDFIRESSEHLNAVSKINNFSVIGRHGGEKWLLHDVLVDTYNKVSSFTN
jgi:protoporphyrinogen oxidase